MVILNEKIIAYDTIHNLSNIDLFQSWNLGNDCMNTSKYANKWRFGFELAKYLKPGLIYILDPNNEDINKQRMLNDYNHRVITFRFNFRKNIRRERVLKVTLCYSLNI
eukprot:TRINITY_DN21909_c0_g1_i1.p1 TRINITY_DN21909_c0_g1~~TRINITY_DN21909_c0_g1_i1.p1  ORF type:complete len:108 (+),score=4.49 TRINITY_DN21909_c0_g1_i1:16-339(+)